MPNVVVYSSDTCSYCNMLKDFLNKKGVPYQEKNVSSDQQARKELMRMGHMGVPVTIINGEEIVGFDRSKLEQLL